MATEKRLSARRKHTLKVSPHGSQYLYSMYDSTIHGTKLGRLAYLWVSLNDLPVHSCGIPASGTMDSGQGKLCSNFTKGPWSLSFVNLVQSSSGSQFWGSGSLVQV
ncbi:hypothetical protein GOODEAATRI_009932 [Goodea atripinnis]|uniref:Uncharacterized protein n=1 Tax=Goodea atripinnis TaxID=208336 RepID=A0ABV0N382_9TELE